MNFDFFITKDEIINSLKEVGIGVGNLDSETTRFFSENGEELYFPDNFNIFDDVNDELYEMQYNFKFEENKFNQPLPNTYTIETEKDIYQIEAPRAEFAYAA